MTTPASAVDQSNDATPTQTTEQPDYAGILSLLKLAREQTSHVDLGFVIVNQTHRVVPYFQAFLWSRDAGSRARVIGASGVSDIDRHAPVVRFLETYIEQSGCAQPPDVVIAIDANTFDADLRAQWLQWFPPFALWCPFIRDDGQINQGLIATSDRPFTVAEQESLSATTDGYAYVWRALSDQDAGTFSARLRWLRNSRWLLIALCVALGCLLLPVRFSVLASARVVPTDPVIVAAPLDGVIDHVRVRPNQKIAAQDLLVEFNDTQAQTNYELAESEYRIAIANYELSVQRSFSDAGSKAENETLGLLVAEKRLAVEFAKTQLARTQVVADVDGIALFVDVDHWKGRPVSTGERIMTIADPQSVEIVIELTPDDGGAVDDKADVDFFLDTDPNNPIKASVEQIAFETELSETGELFFPVTAKFAVGALKPRLGLKGTAKIYGQRVSLFYYLFRKPWSYLRQTLSF